MSTTNQLPEPELGYIKTDKSNQPAFSARQMREALQARAQVQGEPVTVAVDHFDNGPFEAYTNRIHPPVEIGAKLYTTPQTVPMTPASRDVIMATRTALIQVQGEVCPTCGETEPYTGSCGTSNNDTKALCKKPAQATQAEVTGEREAFESCTLMEGSLFKRRADDPDKYWDGNVQDDWELWQARAILALRPVQVPMTDEEIFYAYCKSDSILSTHITNLVAFAKAIEAHHGITAQAKKEGA